MSGVGGLPPDGAHRAIEAAGVREIRLLSSFVNPHTHARAVGLVASGAVAVEPPISRRVGFEAAAAAIVGPAPAGQIRAVLVA